MSARPRIVIDPEAFGAGFDIRVQPPVKGRRYDAEYPTIRGARSYARMLSRLIDAEVVDNSGEPS